MTAPAAGRLLTLATQLDRMPTARERLAAGSLSEGAATAICTAIADFTDEQAQAAEPILMDLADQATAAEIARAGRYLHEILQPGTVEKESREQDADRFLLVSETIGGGLQGRFVLPREAGARLRAWLDANARPKADGDDRPLRVRNADALDALLTSKVTTELLVLVRAESLPDDAPTPAAPAATTAGPTETTAGSTSPGLDDPRRSGPRPSAPRPSGPRPSGPRPSGPRLDGPEPRMPGPAGSALSGPGRMLPGLLLATGQLLPISDIHRLARTSKLVRMVLDADGQVLDMGRGVRLATPAQRRALYSMYDTCVVSGCPLPAYLCQIDHIDAWVEGGKTDLSRLAPACGFHNRDRVAHPDRYELHKAGPGRWAFTYLGVRRRPMRT